MGFPSAGIASQFLDGSWWAARGFTLTLALSHQGRGKVNEGGREGIALPASFEILQPCQGGSEVSRLFPILGQSLPC